MVAFFLEIKYMKKKNRIRKAEEFQEIIHKGKKLVVPSFVFYYMPKKESEARIGISLSKKIGNAVHRNLYKRQLRMMCQDLISFHDYPFDGILIIRFGYLKQDFQTNKKSLEKLLDKATIRSFYK